jgi:hypothetical protein
VQPRKPSPLAPAGLALLETGVLVAALALAVLAGLREIYFGKSFGTIDDYVGLILFGTVATVASPFISGALKSLGAAGSRLPFVSRPSS